jgi:N,N'-diacetylbacillosaminyl-diphospho-undecaprenol alpha-1,3-N-acetylgalactosaminyltransferase
MESVALIYNTDHYMYRFRGPLIRTMVDKGISVHCIAPRGDHAPELERLGARFHHWQLSRRGIGPFGELASLLSLVQILRTTHPTLCHTFTFKPNVYGPIAARLAGSCGVVSTYTGLGYLFAQNLERIPLAQRLVYGLMRPVGRLADAVTFQNWDDLGLLVEMGLVPGKKARLLPGGSGVDTEAFSPWAVSDMVRAALRRKLRLPDDAVVVLFLGRMLWDKGVKEYVACARALRGKSLSVRFLLVGASDEENPRSIPHDQLLQWHATGDVCYLGFREDVVELLAVADLFVYPSYYREGVPRVLIEAAAMGKPIVTTDSVGCREVVAHAHNGLLVPPRSMPDLVQATEQLVLDPDLRCRYGRASRERAVLEFDEAISVGHTVALYEEILDARSRNQTMSVRPNSAEKNRGI